MDPPLDEKNAFSLGAPNNHASPGPPNKCFPVHKTDIWHVMNRDTPERLGREFDLFSHKNVLFHRAAGNRKGTLTLLKAPSCRVSISLANRFRYGQGKWLCKGDSGHEHSKATGPEDGHTA